MYFGWHQRFLLMKCFIFPLWFDDIKNIFLFHHDLFLFWINSCLFSVWKNKVKIVQLTCPIWEESTSMSLCAAASIGRRGRSRVKPASSTQTRGNWPDSACREWNDKLDLLRYQVWRRNTVNLLQQPWSRGRSKCAYLRKSCLHSDPIKLWTDIHHYRSFANGLILHHHYLLLWPVWLRKWSKK